MRMMLSSGMVHEGPTKDALAELLGTPFEEATAVVVLDAILPFPGDKSRMFAHLDEFRALGWREVDVLTLFSGSSEVLARRLRSADVVFCYGGSNHWLAHAWHESGLIPVLREVLAEQIYLGISAGSMIFSTHHDALTDAGERRELDMLGLDGTAPAIALLDFLLLPHLGAPFFPHATDDWATGVAAGLGAESWFLDDDSALVIHDPDADPEIVSGGHWLHFGADGALLGRD